MRRLTDQEQRYAYYGAVWGALWSVLLWAPSYDEQAGVALSGIGLVMAALLALAARRGRRLFTGLACILLAFGPWGIAWVIGLPYLAMAGWLALRSNRLQPRPEPELDENGDIVRRPVVPVPERTVGSSRRRRKKAAEEDAAVATRPPPPPSKRYTPPQRPR